MQFEKWIGEMLRDDGSASLEFITAGMILLVPLVYLVVALSQIHSGEYAVTGAAKQAARIFVLSEDAAHANRGMAEAISVTFADYGIPRERAQVSVRCAHGSGDACLVRGEVVTVRVRADIALPLVPDVLDLDRAASVTVEGQTTQKVSRFWRGG